MRLLLQQDQHLFQGHFRRFYTQSSMPKLPLFQLHDSYLKLLLLKDELLGLPSTSPTLTPEIEHDLAVGYGRDISGRERERLPAIETHIMASATGFTSNVPDLCRFMTAQFTGETTLLTDGTKREMRRIQWLRERALRRCVVLLGLLAKRISSIRFRALIIRK